METSLTAIIITAVATPILTIITLWIKSLVGTRERSTERRERREDAFVNALTKRVEQLEREIKEVYVQLKNRDAEYLKLYQEHAILRAQHEVLQAEYQQTKDELNNTKMELATLKEDIRTKAVKAAEELMKV